MKVLKKPCFRILSTISFVPPPDVAMTGFPRAIYSRIEFEIPSVKVDKHKYP